MDSIAAVILAGGKSSRMGCDKALLPYYGKRLVDVVADALTDAGIKHLYVSGNVEGFRSLPDVLPHHGPVGGICTCIEDLQGYKRILFVPVDLPHITADLIRTLLHAQAHQAIHFAQHPLPCLLSLDEQVYAYTRSMHQRLKNGETMSVKYFLSGLDTGVIPRPGTLSAALTNTNTPQEWQEALRESTHQ